MSVLTNRWAQGAVAFAVLIFGFFVYQANSEDVQVTSTEANNEVQADNSNQENAVNETTTVEENNVDTTKTVYIKDEGVELTEIEVDITE